MYVTYTYMAKDIKYTDDKSVEDALNDLYSKMPSKESLENNSNFDKKYIPSISGADVNQIYLCNYKPQFFFVWWEKSDNHEGWIAA